ncbi:MAG: nucleotidyltransferase domain-containing protein [Maledivibacter sp.]|jgi:predicted nucleotidyltransferase|nr:nucleotidyltransferase domain-containing protein [Maledivibacter sp.]
MSKELIEILKKGIVDNFNPKKIILFGSYAKGTATEKSDIDICIIIETTDRRRLRREISKYIYAKSGLDFDKPVDVLIYTIEEWKKYLLEKGTFANHILNKGVILYDRQHKVQ